MAERARVKKEGVVLSDEQVASLRAAAEVTAAAIPATDPLAAWWRDISAALAELQERRARAAARAARRGLPPTPPAAGDDDLGLGELGPDGVLGELVDDADGLALP